MPHTFRERERERDSQIVSITMMGSDSCFRKSLCLPDKSYGQEVGEQDVLEGNSCGLDLM